MEAGLTRPGFLPSGLGFFPATSSWRWEAYRQNNYVLAGNESWTVWDKSASGWLYYFIMRTDNPDIRLRVELSASGQLVIDISPREIYELGIVGTNPGVITLYRYDMDNNIYVLGYAPQGGLGVPFRGKARAVIYNPGTVSATINFMEAWLIILEEYSY